MLNLSVNYFMRTTSPAHIQAPKSFGVDVLKMKIFIKKKLQN